ncbi:S9 family peptidase [Pseudoalteromonas sp. MMG012]|uniref:alpha/beta hydrolase family protein n=1 Tax=Pseudoalteromonas sp. MMG012 TaxID=2822686 RepID=UPI001B3A7B27|nr:alpha/beta fold hydrolase [Pseudoalteromonas sp. MMG012]MBQ4852744.1 S9 family peptidase [Pseudoalteromonas sp. MMG012]
MITKYLLPSLIIGALSSAVTPLVYASNLEGNITKNQVNTTLIPMADFFNKSLVSDIKLSPSGHWIAFLKELNGAQNIFLVRKGEPLTHAYAVTQSKDPINSFQWSKNDDSLFFLKNDNGNEKDQIHHLTFGKNKSQEEVHLKLLTQNKDATYALLGQVKEMPNQLIVMSNQDESGQLDIFHLDVITGKLKKVLENKKGFRSLSFNSQGIPMIAVSANSDNTSTLYVKNKHEWQAVFDTAFGENMTLLKYDEANHKAYLTGDIQKRDKQELLSFDFKTQSFTTLHQDPENQSDVYKVEFNDDNQPIAVSYYGGHLRTYPLTQAFAQHWTKINSYFNDTVEISVKSMNKKTGQWQITVGSDIKTDRDYSYDVNTQKLHALLNQKPAIAPERLSKRQSINYQSRDGVNIQAYLTLPKNKHKNLPTIILPHGGPWVRDYWTLSSGYFHPVAQLLANRGYAVLQPNFRASTGFGKKFLNAGNKNWGLGNMQHDLTDGVNYLVKQGITDKSRVGIMGASYGGYAALAGVTFTPDIYKAAVSYVGPSSLITLVESFPSHYRPYLGQFFSAVGDPEVAADRKDMNSRSPINFVDNIKTPLLIVQGANDPRVTQLESDNIARVMHKKGLPVEYILAKDEGHGFLKRDNKLAYVMAMEQFFAKHLGGKTSKKTSTEIATHLKTLKVDLSKL